MSNEYLEEEDKKLIKEIGKRRNYARNCILIGVFGGLLMAADYYFSDGLGLETLRKSIKDMKKNEVIYASLVGLSSLSILGGGTIYGMYSFMKKDFEKIKKEEANNKLEKKLKD